MYLKNFSPFYNVHVSQFFRISTTDKSILCSYLQKITFHWEFNCKSVIPVIQVGVQQLLSMFLNVKLTLLHLIGFQDKTELSFLNFTLEGM